mmetsp:Transcript_5941/g.17817  ORF Transcript_5941/g.17817 Transcript_5941/m.17817 type:complete len:147 (+) Transcript_5941:197-637(+)
MGRTHWEGVEFEGSRRDTKQHVVDTLDLVIPPSGYLQPLSTSFRRRVRHITKTHEFSIFRLVACVCDCCPTHQAHQPKRTFAHIIHPSIHRVAVEQSLALDLPHLWTRERERVASGQQQSSHPTAPTDWAAELRVTERIAEAETER